MGITLSADQDAFFNAYNNINKTENSAALDIAYANFLKVLKDVNLGPSKAFIYLNRYLNPAWFAGAAYDPTKLTALNTLLEDYITTTNQSTRNDKHLLLVQYLKNEIVPNLFLQTPLRTKTVFTLTEYTDGGDILPAYVASASSSANIGSHVFEAALMQ